jgi:antitoxin ParD1/3/4
MEISLTPEIEELINEQIESGGYQSACEVIHAGLRLLKEQDELFLLGLEEVRREVRIGLEQLDRGEAIPGDHVLEELRQRSEARRRQSP